MRTFFVLTIGIIVGFWIGYAAYTLGFDVTNAAQSETPSVVEDSLFTYEDPTMEECENYAGTTDMEECKKMLIIFQP